MSSMATLFKKACEENNTQMVRFCLRNEVFRRDTKALQQGLQLSSRAGYIEIVKLLLATKEIKQIANIDKNASLTDAIKYRHEEVANLLLKNKHIKEKVSINATPSLKVAIALRYKFITETLLKNLQIKEALLDDASAIAGLMNNGYETSVKSLLDYAFKNNKSQFTDVFKKSVKRGDIRLVKFFLENDEVRKELANNDNQILSIAIQNGHRELVKLLLTFKNVKQTLNARNNIENLLRIVIQRGDPEIIKQILASLGDDIKPTFLSLLYESSISTLSKMAFVKDSKSDNEEDKDESLVENTIDDSTVIYNQDGYDLDISVSPTTQQGKPLVGQQPSGIYDFFAALNSPIGYNIHLPPPGKEVKNIFVHVYGGGSQRTLSTFARLPGELYDFESDLLNQGNAIATLNLPDLKSDTFSQNETSESLHNLLHKCINQFHNTVKHTPETLHPSLSILKDKDIFLYGMSFGGRTAIRHAELYPSTFTGYISHDGILSGEMGNKSYLQSDRFHLASHLDPANEIEIQKITDPVLLMHNMDDNNVNVLVTLDFYQQMVKNQKSDLARLCLTSVGSPLSESEPVLHNRGHFLPEKKKDYNRYIETLSNFIENGPSALPSITEWQAFRSEKLANKFYKQGNIQQRFIAEVLDRGRLDQDESSKIKKFSKEFMSPKEPQPLWEKHYKPLFYAMHYVDNLASDKQALKTELARLDNENLLTDSRIKKALTINAHMFTSYLNERYSMNVSTDEVVKNDEMVNMFRRFLQSLPTQDPSVTKLVLNALYQAEPTLLASHKVDFEKDTQLQHAANQAKEELKNTIATQRKLISHAWREAAKETLKNNKATNNKPTETTSKPLPKKK